MGQHLVLIRNGGEAGTWEHPDRTTYNEEKDLEAILASHPEWIPNVLEGSQSVQQLQTSSGPIDICIVGSDGVLTLVECKLASNSEHRRQKVGQPIDYAAAVHAAGPDAFRSAWMARGGMNFDQFLTEIAVATLERNISEGNINLCLAVDMIDDDLRQLIEYLNLVTRDEVQVTALELAYVQHEGVEILIPSTFGGEIARAKSAQASASKESWTWTTFVDSLTADTDKEIAEQLRARLDLVPPTGRRDRLWFGLRPRGSINFHLHGEFYAPFGIWVNSAGKLLVYGTWRVWNARLNDRRYEALASLLGQDYRKGSSSVAADALDLDEFWQVAVECDRALNDISPD